jgi:hypothetical protein
LNDLREIIRNEGDRVRDEIIKYASRKQSLEVELTTILGSLKQWNERSN